jgi:hypothetical protein
MKNFVSFFIIVLSLINLNAQITQIPDPNFEQALIDLGIDSDGIINGQVITADIANITSLDVRGYGINDLTGIEDFISLEELFCGDNNYNTTFNLNNNSELRVLECRYCNLSSLDLGNNLQLEYLYCGNEVDMTPPNTFTQLDLSNNINLKEFWGSDLLYLESLDLSNNPLIEYVDISSSLLGLSELNLANGNNSILVDVIAYNNQFLFCIEVDDAIAANNGDYPYSEWFVDPQIIYSEDCVLGVEESLIQQISVIPNPFDDMLFIESDPSILIESIHIYSVLGELILSKTDNFNQIDVSALRSGVYFLKVSTSNGKLTKKLVKR